MYAPAVSLPEFSMDHSTGKILAQVNQESVQDQTANTGPSPNAILLWLRVLDEGWEILTKLQNASPGL